MTNLAHIAETALLLLAAYLLGCVVGYAARRILHAGRGTRQLAVQAVAPVVASPQERRPRSPAARLAASVDDLPLARPVIEPPPASPLVVEPAIAAKTVAKKSVATKSVVTEPITRRSRSKPSSKARASDPKPIALPEPRNGSADNLRQIKGIGPKIEASLYAMGVFHIDQIAGWSKANIDWVEAEMAFKGRVRRERWVEQAVELSKARVSA